MLNEAYIGNYGPYTILENGLPDFNEVVADFLKKSEIGLEEFGRIYGIAARNEPYTRIRIYQMIHNKSFPTDSKRRWILATLLQIPPALLGVTSLEQLLLSSQEVEKPLFPLQQRLATPQTISPTSLNIKEAHQALGNYWKLHRISTAFQHVGEIKTSISQLEKALLYGDRKEKQQNLSLLCGFHMLLSNMASDKEEYNKAILYLNRAYLLASEGNLFKLQVAILCRRGWVFKERGENTAALGYFGKAEQDYTFATDDFTAALSLKKYLSPGIQGSALMSLGQLKAHTAQDGYHFHQAIKQIDTSEQFIGRKDSEDDIHSVTFDEERYHLDKAAAYLASPVKMARYPRDARRELRNALAAQATPIPKRRLAYNTILQAKSYLVEEDYEQAIDVLKQALSQTKSLHSHINLARIASMHGALQKSTYAKGHIDVAVLEVEIFKAQHPKLFNI
ncbi:hypothetical protein EPA93_07190 [Ktedonosporobacter rubrisoli]|uniref:Tetratricopeptide repeat protein n=1 Tax=Ktedonosporobacter rubrisoli TaxID=2509675 RepID=A0A4P6JLD1_KTERU|nr:hypothetical protein [Ktedonosporobacter rubrisoli]QBD75802.1 hypothetical protein EPA93_07190 [Ktedonosporobacter rubrisoli]